MAAERRAENGIGMIRAGSDNARPRPALSPVPTPAEQAAFEDRMVDWLVRVNEGWLRRQEAGR